VLILDTHDTTAPLSGKVGVVVELGLEHGGHLFQVNDILAADISDSDAGSRLEVDELSKVGLATDEAEGDTLLAAESGKMDDELDGVDVVGNDDKLGLVLLNESGHMVETKLEVHGLLTLGATFASLGLASHSCGLLSAGLRHVLGHQFNELGRLVLLDSLAELVDRGRHLKSLHQDPLLSLDADVAGPLDEASQVTLRLDVSSKSEVASRLLEERTRSRASTTATSLGLNDLLSLGFLHHND